MPEDWPVPVCLGEYGSDMRTCVAVLLVLLLASAGCGGDRATGASPKGDTPTPCLLKAKLVSRSEDPPGQFHANIVVENTDDLTHKACRVSGAPDVELIGPALSMFGSIYSLPQSLGRNPGVTLRLGQSAHAVLTWLPWERSNPGPWLPDYIRVVVHTNRGPTFAVALPWRYGSVLRQDDATHPGTYVGPISRGA